ncbi:MAG TPA: tetratricopeptide repeat protein [Bryobacteraceae bacterium]|nr:tetratricopeptide repeat protein [Bryobacteraceae bacterium]
MSVTRLCCLLVWTAAALLGSDRTVEGNASWSQCIGAGGKALERGQYNEAVLWYEIALRTISPDNVQQLRSRALAADGLGSAQVHLQNFAEAEAEFRYAMILWRDLAGGDDANVAAELNNIGTICFRTARLEEARRCFQEALKIDENTQGPNSAAVANDLNSLAGLASSEGQVSHAETLLRRAIDIASSVSPPDIRLLDYQRNLAVMYARLNRFEDARQINEQILDTEMKMQGRTHPNVGLTLKELAYCETGLSQCEEAILHAQESIAILGASLGEDNPSTGIAYFMLGLGYRCGGQLDLAETALKRAVDIDERAGGPAEVRGNHLREYAGVLRSRGKKVLAKKYEQMATMLSSLARPRAGVVDIQQLAPRKR